jgi:hypothetical protein
VAGCRGVWCGGGSLHQAGLHTHTHAAPRNKSAGRRVVRDSDDGFDDFPDVDGWGFGFGT